MDVFYSPPAFSFGPSIGLENNVAHTEAKTKNTLWTNHIAVVELDGGKHFAPEELTSYREDAKPLRDRGRGSR